MFDYNGSSIRKAGPSMPVSVAGLSGMPEAGEQFRVVESEKVARKIIADEELNQRQGPLAPKVDQPGRILQPLARRGNQIAEPCC